MNLLPLTFKFKKEGKKLVFLTPNDKLLYEHLEKIVPNDTVVTVTCEVLNDDGSYAQLSKIHKCIRELALHTGSTFEEMKHIVKERSGLFINNEYKSFADCSKDDLDIVIKSLYEIGENVNFPLQ